MNIVVNRTLIVIQQPSGTDCIAVTKYDKIGEDFFAKINTRIICLLDLNRLGNYLEWSHMSNLFDYKKKAFFYRNFLSRCYTVPIQP